MRVVWYAHWQCPSCATAATAAPAATAGATQSMFMLGTRHTAECCGDMLVASCHLPSIHPVCSPIAAVVSTASDM
eukprot:10712698-Alexandrium_andersonii.AAC.1